MDIWEKFHIYNYKHWWILKCEGIIMRFLKNGVYFLHYDVDKCAAYYFLTLWKMEEEQKYFGFIIESPRYATNQELRDTLYQLTSYHLDVITEEYYALTTEKKLELSDGYVGQMDEKMCDTLLKHYDKIRK